MLPAELAPAGERDADKPLSPLRQLEQSDRCMYDILTQKCSQNPVSCLFLPIAQGELRRRLHRLPFKFYREHIFRYINNFHSSKPITSRLSNTQFPTRHAPEEKKGDLLSITQLMSFFHFAL